MGLCCASATNARLDTPSSGSATTSSKEACPTTTCLPRSRKSSLWSPRQTNSWDSLTGSQKAWYKQEVIAALQAELDEQPFQGIQAMALPGYRIPCPEIVGVLQDLMSRQTVQQALHKLLPNKLRDLTKSFKVNELWFHSDGLRCCCRRHQS